MSVAVIQAKISRMGGVWLTAICISVTAPTFPCRGNWCPNACHVPCTHAVPARTVANAVEFLQATDAVTAGVQCLGGGVELVVAHTLVEL